MDEEETRPKIVAIPLDRMGVAELGAYVEALRTEIARAEAQIAQKQSHRSAADAFFKK